MKIKQFLTITDPSAFLKGDHSSCFSLFNHRCDYEGWVVCGEVEFDVDIDTMKVRETAMQKIETQLTAARVLLNTLESQRRDLLAIGYDGSLS